MKYPFYHIIKDYFRYSKTEKQSFFALIFIAVLIYAFSYIYRVKTNKAVSVNYPEIKEYSDFSNTNISPDNNTKGQARNIKPFKFEINTVSYKQLLQLGFTKKVAQQYIKYRNAIGGFKKVEQLKKLYSMNDKLYDRILPYASVAPQPMAEYANRNNSFNKKNWKKDTIKRKNYVSKYPKKTKFTGILELNTCDTTDLKKLTGIGSYFAKSIIKEREKLSGFTNINQLKEIWGLKEKFEAIKENLTVDKSRVRKLNINKAKYNQLWKHPYIYKSEAHKIIKEKYRGKFTNFENFKQRMDGEINKIDELEDYLTY